MDKQPNVRNLPPELIEKIQRWEENRPENKQLQVLADIASIAQELINVGDDSNDKSDTISKQLDALGAVLTDSREQLVALNKKEAPETPDYAKPVVGAVEDLKTALTVAIKGIEVSPKVAAPNVKVEAPKLDLSGVEKAMREIPKALEAAIKKMPQTEIPKTDLSPLVSKFDDMLAKLSEIDTGVRMKPQSPSTLKVTNPDGSPIGSSLTPGTDFDYIDCQQTSATIETYVYKQGGSGGTTVQTITVTYVDSSKNDLDKVEYS